MIDRRRFLARSALFASGWPLLSRAAGAFQSNLDAQAKLPGPRTKFETSDTQYQSTYSQALSVLAKNTTLLENHPQPVLIEGSTYAGIWMECAPYEGLVYADVRTDVARNNHLAFFAQQHDDGQIPGWIRNKTVGFGQIQMVVPIAATAWEVAHRTGDNELLEKAYAGCRRWDAWLRHYRDTRHTGLCEGFCTYDTGHDNSPRWSGIPNRCPDADARKCPPLPSMPRICPDLSATVYGGRVALSSMARALGKNSEADRWQEDAEAIRSLILRRLYSEEDAAFYDEDAQDHFVRVRGDVITRVLGEHVVDQKLFETIYKRQIHNPAAFWPAYPLPSIALDDPTFVRPIPRNSWGGASQALTALRAARWMEHYGKPADFAQMMQQWNAAILRKNQFLQQLDPLNGEFTVDTGDYSPAALVFIDFTWRLCGVRQVEEGLEWNVRPGDNKLRSNFHLRTTPTRTAELRYADGHAELVLNGKPICQTKDTVRIVTEMDGKFRRVVGITQQKAKVTLRHPSQHKQTVTVVPNAIVTL